MTSPITYHSQIHLLANLKLTYVEIPEEILLQTKTEDDKSIYNQRFYIQVNDSEVWQAGVVALGEGKGYITVKKDILKKNQLTIGDEVTVKLERNFSEYGLEVSEEFLEVLRQDPEGERRFNLLPLGKRRYIIYYVNQVKSSTKKIERAWFLISNLKKLPVGKEEFRGILGKDN